MVGWSMDDCWMIDGWQILDGAGGGTCGCSSTLSSSLSSWSDWSSASFSSSQKAKLKKNEKLFPLQELCRWGHTPPPMPLSLQLSLAGKREKSDVCMSWKVASVEDKEQLSSGELKDLFNPTTPSPPTVLPPILTDYNQTAKSSSGPV